MAKSKTGSAYHGSLEELHIKSSVVEQGGGGGEGGGEG
jgi:hypothetical protein